MIITAGTYKGRKIDAPDESITRPTLSQVRMSVFNTLFSIMGDFENKTFFDAFGGSGIMGLEALSRGFTSVKVCEKNPKAASVIKKNYAKIGLKPDLIIGDSVKYLKNNNSYFDVVYIDPPYKSGIYDEILSIVTGNIIVVEHSENLLFSEFELLKQKKGGNKLISYIRRL